jgi:hypothetical protein
MKHTLLTFLLLIPFILGAQDVLTVDPNPYIESFEVDLSDNWSEPIAHAYITNETSEEFLMRWDRVVIDAPAEWEYRVCDGNQCYGLSTSTNWEIGNPAFQIPDTLSANEVESTLDLHVLPRGVAGVGTIHVNLYNADDPEELVTTAVFEVTISGVSSVSEQERQRLQVFPNPTDNFIELSNTDVVDQVLVYNLLGKQVRSFDVVKSEKYSLIDLPNGIYMVSLLNNEEGILKTVRVSKRTVRP